MRVKIGLAGRSITAWYYVGDHPNPSVFVSKQFELGEPEKMRPATINWTAFGSVTPEVAREMAKVIAHASWEATALDIDYPAQSKWMERHYREKEIVA